MASETKYKHLNGYPHDGSLAMSFLHSAGMQAGALCSLFTIATAYVTHDQSYMGIISAASLALPALMTAKSQFLETAMSDRVFDTNLLRLSFFKNAKRLVIDTAPEKISTSADNLRKARGMRNGAIVTAAVLGSFTAGAFALHFYEMAASGKTILVGNSALMFGLVGQVIAPFMATSMSSARRFNKVVQREYVITDAPPIHEARPVKLALTPSS